MQKKIRILHMTPPIINNGVYRYIFTLLKYIDKSKFEFDFLIQNSGELMQTEEYQKYKFGIRSFTTTQRENPKKFRQEIYDILSDGYDILELHTSYWRGFMIEEIAMEIGIPRVIVHSHSSGLDNNDSLEREKQLAIHEQFKSEFNCNYATDFWACSKEAGEWLFGEQIPREQIKYIHNAIEVKKYIYDEEIRNKKRKELGLDNCFVIGNTGRFEYQKNHEFLIRVFAEVCKHIDNARLLLVGEGKLLQKMIDLGKQLGVSDDIIFLGWRTDVNQLLQVMDVYALPSWFEGLPLVLIEAQTSGLLCMASDRISLDASVTDRYISLPLINSTWKEYLIALYHKSYTRHSNSEEVRKAGYDIEFEIHNIEKLYFDGLEDKKCV